MTLTIHLNECPVLSDGRVQHYFRRVDGELTCQTCGEVREHPFVDEIGRASCRERVL